MPGEGRWSGPGVMTRFLPSPAGVCAWSPQRRQLRAAAEQAGAGSRRAGGKEASEQRGLGALQCYSNAFPGRSPRGPPCPALPLHVAWSALVRAEPPRGGRLRAGLSGGSAEPLRACGVSAAAGFRM